MRSPCLSISYHSDNHIPVLDGLRGCAVLMVIIFHCFVYLPMAKLGWIGVDLFFVLSGFLITGILIRTKSHTSYFKNFISKRVLRIFPLYYFSLVLFFWILPIFFNPEFSAQFTSLYDKQIWYWLYLQNWLIAIYGWPASDLLNHFWSLAIEEQFYIFWPLVVFVLSDKKILIASLAMIAFSLGVRISLFWNDFPFYSSYVSTITRFDSLCVGATLAVMLKSHSFTNFLNKIVPWVMYISISLYIIVVLFFSIYEFESPFFVTVGYTLNAVTFGAILAHSLSTHKNNWLSFILNNRILIFFGKYSYGMYVYHWPIYVLLNPFFYELLLPIIKLKGFTSLGSSTICLVITVMVSLVSYKLLESPFLRLKKYFNTRSNVKLAT